MNLRKLIFTQNACYKSGRKMTPKGIMVHSTGANNPWLKRYVGPDDGLLGKNQYNNHWNQAMNRSVCVHGFIGKLADGSIATYQTLPWDMVGWHSGSGSKGSAANANNNGYIGFEICEDGLSDATYFNKVYLEAVELCAYLCDMYGIKPESPYLICHSEGHKLGIASNHGDVMHWFPKHGKSMNTFRADVKARMKSSSTSNSGSQTTTTSEMYRVRKSWSDAKSQIGAYRNLDNAKKACKEGYKVFNSAGEVVYSPAASTPAVSTANNSSNESLIYNWLVKNSGLNTAAIAGILANLNAESGFKSTNLQQTYEKKLGYTDATYTAAVDDGSYTNFIKDSAGYGLVQWTYWSRKQGLLEYAKSKKASIGDYIMQLEYMLKELKNYSKVWKTLTSTANTEAGAYECGRIICYDFEAPAARETSQVTRGNSAKEYFKKYTKSTATETPAPTPVAPTTAKTYVLKTKVKGYNNAADAKAKKNAKTTLAAGTYYIYNKYPNGYNGMMNITTDKTGKVPGSWINPAENVVAAWTPKKGDKVIVNGSVAEYGNGKGNNVKMTNKTMYITEVLSSKIYSNYIGVSLKKGGTRYGWVKRDSIKQA